MGVVAAIRSKDGTVMWCVMYLLDQAQALGR